MKNSLQILLCVLANVLTPAINVGQVIDRQFDRLFEPLFSHEAPGGTTLVMKGGKVLYKKAFGLSDLELGVKMNSGQAFRIGSITKQFTACAIMQLAEQGKLSLQDSITRFVDDYPVQGDKITIEHLLTHTSGIRNITGMPAWTTEVRKKDLTPKELVDFFKNEKPEFDPGSEYRYSNSNYILLGYIIEVITGRTYERYLNEVFFQPLGMTHTAYDHPSEIVMNRAKGYQKVDGQYKHADFISMTQPFSAGAILSNTDDLFTWYDAVMHDKVITKASLEKARTPFTLSDGRVTNYGYGWELGNVQGSASIRHGGRINGFVTSSIYLPEEEVFVAVFSNCDCANGIEEAATKAAAIAIGRPYEWLRVQRSEQELKAYEGVYESAAKDERVISFEDGRLVYFPRKRLKLELRAFDKDQFHIENSLMSVHFSRNKKGVVESFVLKGTERDVTWLRTQKEVEKLQAIRIAPEALDPYVGRYRFGTSYFVIARDGDKLYGTAPGNDQVKQEIVAFGEHRFFARNVDARLVFEVDENGKVIGLTLIQNGEKKAPKVE